MATTYKLSTHKKLPLVSIKKKEFDSILKSCSLNGFEVKVEKFYDSTIYEIYDGEESICRLAKIVEGE